MSAKHNIHKNPPAFPRPISHDAIPLDHSQYGDNIDFQWAQEGMTLRDYFAGCALMGLCAFPGPLGHTREPGPEDHATMAYRYADAMLEEREKEAG